MSAEVLDRAVVDELEALGGEELLSELVTLFVSETTPLLAELRAAFESGDAAGVARLGHRVKGSSSQLGGSRLAAACSALEQRGLAGGLDGAQDDLRAVEDGFGALRQALQDRLAAPAA